MKQNALERDELDFLQFERNIPQILVEIVANAVIPVPLKYIAQ